MRFAVITTHNFFILHILYSLYFLNVITGLSLSDEGSQIERQPFLHCSDV